MPSNTDDGIVEKVAAEMRMGAVVVACEVDTFRRVGILDELSARELARAAISIYESHLRDKGMVVVPVMTESQPLMFSQTIVNEDDSPVDITRTVSASPVQSEAEIVERGALRELERKRK